MKRGLFAILMPLAWAAGAAERPSEALFLAELPTVLTASRIAQSALDAPAPVTVIDRATIRASGVTEIHDLLRLVPGFQVADWPKGGAVAVNHGLGDALPRRLLVLVDGFPVLDAAFGTVHWEDLPIHLEDVERIEVVRGPNQASFGASAYQGVVHIITRRAGEDAGAAAVLALGERDFDNLYARYGRHGDEVDWRISASSRRATPFRDRALDGYEYGERLTRRTLNAQLAYHPSVVTEWRAVLGVSDGEDAVGSTLDGAAYPNHGRDNRNLFLQLGWRGNYAPGSELSLQYGHFERQARESYGYVYGPLTTPVDYDIDTWRDDLAFQQIHAFSDRLKGVWGAGLRHDQAESERYLYGLGRVEDTQWQVYGNLDWRLAPDWLLHAGAMLEDHGSTDPLFSPRLALNYFIGPRQGVRVSAGRGYRAPSVMEARAREAFVYKGADFLTLGYGDVVDLGIWSDGSVRPEQLDFIELGYIGHFPELGLNVDARVYAERHDDFINTAVCAVPPNGPTPACTLVPPAGYYQLQQDFGSEDKAYVFANEGKNRVHGLDLSLDWQHPRWGRFLFAHAITFIHSGITDAGTRADAELSAPLHATSLLWSKGFGHGIQAGLGLYRVGDMIWMGDGDDQPAYTRVDLRLAKRLGGGEDEVALVVRNLNGDHVEFRDSARVERQAFVTLRLGW